MARQRRIQRIAPGIWRDGNLKIAEVRVGSSRDGNQERVREEFPLSTATNTMIAWRLSTKAKFLKTRPAAGTARGTLAADVPTYLATLPEGRYRNDSKTILGAWVRSPLGAMSAREITDLDIIGQIARWTEDRAATNTCNKRLVRLRLLYRRLYPGANPTDGIKGRKEDEVEPRDIPTRAVKLIVDSLPDLGRADKGQKRPKVNLTKVRLAVMAWTGMGGATLRRVTPQHLKHLAHGRMYLTARRKGKGVVGSWVNVIPPAVDALRAFAAAGLFGKTWSRSSMRQTWLRGIERAQRAAADHHARTGDDSWLQDLLTLPPGCKPYDLRHSFGSEMYRLTGDPLVVKELLQHAGLDTTARYTKGAVSERVRAAIASAAVVYAAVPSLPAAPTVAPLRLVKSGAR